ncbi:hypothetical protein FOCC_FOCC003963 [Frankliniella occidentalis]|nr:hypothetical protein FOCC_FOCC003963 [Frankliniella occidentalis]
MSSTVIGGELLLLLLLLLLQLPPPQPKSKTLCDVGLLELPDVALLRVLSYLDVNDLMALGLAIPTLAAFSRASTALWCRGPWTIGATFRDVRGLIFLLRVAPPVDRLTVQTRYFHPDEDEGDSFRFESSRGQLRCVEVNAPKLVPLIDACSPGALHRLSVPPAKGVTALIRRMAGEELKINQRRLEDEDGVEEVDDFLRSWSTPCALLELHLFRPETFAALGVGGLGRLQHLVLDEPRDFMRQLDLVLAGLPHLRSLTTMMRAVFAPDLFDLPAASIPALEQLLIKGDGYCKAPTPCHCKECVRVDQLGPVLQALVRRAPAPLHAAFLWTRKYGEDGDDEPREGVVPWGGREPGYPVFHRHARKEGGEKEEDCALCDQAVASVHARSHDGVLLRHVCCK